ncbi:MAG: threonine synthase [Candidatus Eisenbacteria bacterium]|nr:threonine synthase [Candidatus Eisenbacteria bacterium]
MQDRGATITGFVCAKCGRSYGADQVRYVCPDCGGEGILDVLYDYEEMARRVTRRSFADTGEFSLWRYLPMLPVASSASAPPLRAGWTPLYRAEGLLGLKSVFVKDDSRNPTASLKDRATAVGVARAASEQVGAVAAASTGNAGCSLAGFAAAMGMRCYIFVPKSAPRPKVAQLLVFGATVFAVDGSYDDAFDLAMEAIERFGWYNRCCAVNPFLVEGKKTVALEVAEQMGFEVPDKVFLSVGDGCIASGVAKGFRELEQLGLTDRVPRIIGVQAEGCSPVCSAFESGSDVEPATACTCADSIAVGHPRNWRKALKGIRASGGKMMTVTDEEIIAAIPELARATGVFGEPAGVTSFAGLAKAVRQGEVESDETIVVLMTGSGLKDTESAMRSAGQPVPVGREIGDVEAKLRELDAAGRRRG